MTKEKPKNSYPESFEDCRKGEFVKIPMVYIESSVSYYPENYPFEDYMCESVLFEFLIDGEPILPDFMRQDRKSLIV